MTVTPPLKPCSRCGATLPRWTTGSVCWSCMLRADAHFEETTTSTSSPARDLTVTQFPISFGDYLLEAELAHGGMGVVYRARQKSLNRSVAIKLLLLGRFSSAKSIERFRREAQAAAALQHPNIVSIYEVGQCEGQHYIAMEFIEGENLAERLRREPLPARRAIEICQRLATAIRYAHEQGVLHRDLKPSNVLIDAFGEPRLTDFGLAKKLDGSADLTVTGQMVGTPSYLSPEQASGKSSEVGPASDVYSLGALLYETLSGRPPFLGESLPQTLAQIRDAEPVSPRDLNPALDRDLETICLKCLQKDPRHRYLSAAALAEDLQRWLDHKPIRARPVPAATRVLLWCKRNPRHAFTVLLITFLAGTGFMSVLAQWRRAERHRARAEIEQENLRQHLYASDMSAATRAYEEGDLGLMRDLLERQLPAKTGSSKDFRGFEWNYLWTKSRGDAALVLQGHSNLVQCVAFSPDGRHLVSGSWDGTVKLWDLTNGTFITNLFDSHERVLTVSFSGDGQRVAVGGWSSFQVLNLATREIELHEKGNWTRGEFIPGSSRLVHSSNNSYWHGQGGETLLQLPRETGFTLLPKAGGRFAASANGKILATGIVGNRITFWNCENGKTSGGINEVKRLTAIVLSRQADWLAASTEEDNLVHVWSVPDGRSAGELEGDQLIVRALAASPTENLLATAGEDRRIAIWDMTSRSEVASFSGHENEVHALAFSADGQWLASGGKDDTIRIWKVHGEGDQDALPETGCRFGLAYPLLSPDGSMIAVNSPEGNLDLIDIASRQKRRTLAAHRSPVAFSPDGRFLVSVMAHGLLEVWDVATGAAVGATVLPKTINPETRVALSPDGKWVSFCAGGMFLCDARTGGDLEQVATHQGIILGSTFSPNSQWLASSGQDGVVKVWDVEKKTLRVFRGHKADTRGLAFSEDSKLLASGSFDDEVKIWDVENTREIVTLRGHKSPVNALAFAHDGKTLLSLSDDSLRFWNVALWRESGALNTPQRNRLMTISAAGNIAATCDGSQNGPVRLYRAPSSNNVSQAVKLPAGSWALTNLASLRQWQFRGETVPVRPAEVPLHCLDLTAHYNGLLNHTWIFLRDDFPMLPGLLTAPRQLDGIDWDARGVIQLNGREQEAACPIYSPTLKGIAVNQSCQKIHFLVGAHWGNAVADGPIARLIFHYADGNTATRDVTVGVDVADWWYSLNGSPELPGMKVAWTENYEFARQKNFGVRLFRVSWENPRLDAEVARIDLISTMQGPNLFVCAITTE